MDITQYRLTRKASVHLLDIHSAINPNLNKLGFESCNVIDETLTFTSSTSVPLIKVLDSIRKTEFPISKIQTIFTSIDDAMPTYKFICKDKIYEVVISNDEIKVSQIVTKKYGRHDYKKLYEEHLIISSNNGHEQIFVDISSCVKDPDSFVLFEESTVMFNNIVTNYMRKVATSKFLHVTSPYSAYLLSKYVDFTEEKSHKDYSSNHEVKLGSTSEGKLVMTLTQGRIQQILVQVD